MSDKQSKGRILVEGAVIVASILLAFTIDRVYEDARDRGEERTILEGLRSDFRANRTLLDRYIVDYTTALDDTDMVVAYLAPGGAETVDAELDRALSFFYANGTFDPQTATLDLVESSGRGSLLSDVELRGLIAEWRVHWEDALDQQQGLQRYREITLWPVMIELDIHAPDGARRVEGVTGPVPPRDVLRGSDLGAALDLFSALSARTLNDLREVGDATDRVLARVEGLLGG